MPFLDLEPEKRVIVIILMIIAGFALLAKIDLVVEERDSLEDDPIVLPGLTIGQHWFYMWVIGYPAFATFVVLFHFLTAPDTDKNMWYGFGLFATVILFAVGQLEDFLWHIVNGLAFPTGDWSVWGWSAENNICWKLFGTWNTTYHLIWFSSFMIIVIVMWYIIITRT